MNIKKMIGAVLFLSLLSITCAGADFAFQDEEDGVSLKDHFGQEYNTSQEILEAALVQARVRASDFENDDINYEGREPEIIEEAYEAEDDGSFTWDPFVVFTSQDGTVIRGNVFHPSVASPGQTFPAIVFVNSWSMDEHEYIAQAAKFAKKGYIVLSYSTRGFGFSGGQINVAGPKDMEDLSAALDWLEAHTQVDVNNIGMAGISYGAGISLIGAGTEDRVKTAVAMSGWTDLMAALWGGESPRLVWGTLLISLGYITGRMDPEIIDKFATMIAYRKEKMDETIAWAAERSAHSYIDNINAKKKPIYIANNFQDDLFQPNMLMDFYAELEGPKRLDLNQGMHATAELTGLLGLPNYIWDNTHDWFDHFLKGEDTGILDKKPVTMEKKLSEGAFAAERIELNDWPTSEVGSKSFQLKPRTTFPWRSAQLVNYNNKNKSTTYFSGLDTMASTGIPLISPILEAHLDVPTKLQLNDFTVSRLNGVYYMSDELNEDTEIVGMPELDIQATPSRSQAMFMVYLYDVDSNGKGTLITHGTRSLHEARSRKKTDVDIDLVATAYEVPAGHRLAIAIDTFDIMYSVPTLRPYSVKIHHSPSNPSVLTVPTRN